MAGIGDNGIYQDWSPYFNYSTPQLFELSKQLPLPTKKIARVDESGVDISEFTDILQYQKNKNYHNFLQRLTQLLEVSKDGVIKFNESVSNNDRLALTKIINKHNTYYYRSGDAIKNKIFSNMFNIGTNPRNYVAETTILNIDAAREIARNSPKSKENSSNSNNNPAALMIAQEQALTGKTTIGGYANGIKSFSATVVYFKTGIERANAAYNELLRISRENLIANGIESDNPIQTALDLLYNNLGEISEEDQRIIDNAIITEDTSSLKNNAQIEYVSAKILEKYANTERFKIKVNGKTELVPKVNGKDLKLKFSTTLPNIDLLNMETTSPFILDLIKNTREEGVQENVYDTLGILLNCATD